MDMESVYDTRGLSSQPHPYYAYLPVVLFVRHHELITYFRALST